MGGTREPWYKNAIIYGVDVATFQDANGDGIGDFMGVCDRLDYLTELGVTCLWLLPFFPTPNRDNGYDVKNYYEVDPRLGTFEDFLRLVHRAGERGIRIMIDLVMDHTSDEHPWFQAARRDRNSRYRRYYEWSDAPPPTEPDKVNIFPGEESSVWTYDEIAGQYYFHRFYHFEPDLNVMCQDVRDEIERVIDYWLSFGISGFRVDAVSHMIEAPHKAAEASMAHDPHQVIREIRAYTSRRRPEAVLLGEADVGLAGGAWRAPAGRGARGPVEPHGSARAPGGLHPTAHRTRGGDPGLPRDGPRGVPETVVIQRIHAARNHSTARIARVW